MGVIFGIRLHRESGEEASAKTVGFMKKRILSDVNQTLSLF